MIDERSALVAGIIDANPRAYGALVVEGGTPALARKLLEGVHLPAPVMAGLWLWHDGLHESHSISQSLHDATGSWWHAIMHRREGDFSNSKYWYAKTGGHPAHAALGAQAGAIVTEQAGDPMLKRVVGRGFDHGAFVDLVEHVHHNPGDPRRAAVVALQRLEWRILFDQCCKADQAEPSDSGS